MSSINFKRGLIAECNMEEIEEKQEQGEFFSIAQEYNQRRFAMTKSKSLKNMDAIENFKFKTMSKEDKNPQVREEKSRKTRTSQEGREFICGACKSAYLSYPALYTHIKVKHNGICPEGTIRGKSSSTKKRGRPKTLRKQPSLEYQHQIKSDFPAQYCKIVRSVDIQFTQEKEEDEDIEITAPLLVKQIQQLRKSSSALITLPMIKVLAIFMYNLRQLVKADSFHTLQSFTVNLIQFINNHYEEVLNHYQTATRYYVRKVLPKKQKYYCCYEKCDYLPVFAQAFMNRMSDEEINHLEEMFLNDICQWMYTKELTYIKLIRKEEYEVGEGNH